MQAIVIHEYGGPHTLAFEEAPDPRPGPDMVVVELRAAGVNPVDWKIREGYLHDVFPSYLPLIPGWDAAGVVRAIGPAVQEFHVGDAVVGYVRKDYIQHGTYAELVAGTPRHFAPKPSSVDFTAAAGLPLAGLTAVQSLRLAGVGAGDTVLVHAAAGGVGSFAVQWAQVLGAQVVGTASAANQDYLRELGARPVTYGDGLAERVQQAAPDGITASVDYIGTKEALAASAELVGDPQRIVSNVNSRGVAAVGGRYSFVRPQAEDLAELSRQVDAGAVRIVVQEAFPFSDVARAHEISRDGHVRGKLVLEL
ncbi:MAG TPA: NADP-dependent oxidoreductase [Euzebyales bacterium]|nr:NADP-dependent oxidoreductase [Euzebyales bacterium]